MSDQIKEKVPKYRTIEQSPILKFSEKKAMIFKLQQSEDVRGNTYNTLSIFYLIRVSKDADWGIRSIVPIPEAMVAATVDELVRFAKKCNFMEKVNENG